MDLRRTDLESGAVTARLLELGVSFVALAGFLMKVPDGLVAAFSGRMLNLHPSLLPAFGGKACTASTCTMPCMRRLVAGEVHRTCTPHWVDAEYDTWATFFQAEAVSSTATRPASIAKKVRQSREEHYAPETLRAVRDRYPCRTRQRVDPFDMQLTQFVTLKSTMVMFAAIDIVIHPLSP